LARSRQYAARLDAASWSKACPDLGQNLCMGVAYEPKERRGASRARGRRAAAAERWKVLPLTPAPLPSERSGQADVNGISIHYAIYGEGSPVIMLHGGMANADYWGHQIPALAPRHTVIVMDSRVARPLGST
jgi:hypothetical protein